MDDHLAETAPRTVSPAEELIHPSLERIRKEVIDEAADGRAASGAYDRGFDKFNRTFDRQPHR